MEPIEIAVTIKPAEGVAGAYISRTSYGICGQGSSVEEARRSAMDVVMSHLAAYAQQSQPIPLPTAVRAQGAARIGTETVEARQGLPGLVFEFYMQ